MSHLPKSKHVTIAAHVVPNFVAHFEAHFFRPQQDLCRAQGTGA